LLLLSHRWETQTSVAQRMLQSLAWNLIWEKGISLRLGCNLASNLPG
jgi:hypothetical protein